MTYLNSRRCVDCDINWPVTGSYHKCPICGESTYEHDDPHIPYKEARTRIEIETERRQKYRRFEEYYERRELAALRKDLDAGVDLAGKVEP